MELFAKAQCRTPKSTSGPRHPTNGPSHRAATGATHHYPRSHAGHTRPSIYTPRPAVLLRKPPPKPCELREFAFVPSMDSRVFFVAVAIVAAASVVGVGGDFAADRAECADTLVALATCLTYVQDQAAAPTPDCCAGLKTLLQTSRKCLCVLVKDRDDPSLGFKINVTKALGLPAVCNAPANISDCPRLLNLPPNSKDAQIFEQYAKQEAAQGSPSGTGGSAANAGAHKNVAGPARMKWLGMDGVGGGARAVVLFFFSAAVPLAVPFLLVLG